MHNLAVKPIADLTPFCSTKFDTELPVFEFVHDGMTKGAIGLNLGRNIWQHEHPVAMAKALHAIIHKDATPSDANDIFNETKNG